MGGALQRQVGSAVAHVLRGSGAQPHGTLCSLNSKEGSVVWAAVHGAMWLLGSRRLRDTASALLRPSW